MKLKQASYKNGRGYSGWHKGYYGQNAYCRSLLEKIYCLILDEQKIFYETEKQTYLIDGYNYKPDFFIYDLKTKSLKMIREIKGTNKERNDYLKSFSIFFKKCDIDYDVIVIDKRKYYKKWKDELDMYKSNSDSYIQSGDLNPMFGIHHTEITKNKIKDKTTERWNNTEQRQKMIDGIKNTMIKPEIRNKISIGKKRYERRKRRKKLRSIIAKEGGYIEKECYICKEKFIDRVFNKRKHCFSYSCVQKNSPKNSWKKKWEYKEKKDRFKNTLIKIAYKNFELDELNENDFNVLRKKRLYNKSPLSLNSIKKYFGNIDNFKRSIKKWQRSNE